MLFRKKCRRLYSDQQVAREKKKRDFMNVKTIHKVEPTKQFSLLCRMGEQLQRELYGKVVRDSLSLCTFPSFFQND